MHLIFITMARKVYYSKPLKFFWEQLYKTQKNYTPEFTDQEIFYVLKRNLLTIPLGPDEAQVNRQMVISGLEMWHIDAKGELLHIFFQDRAIREFLEVTPLSDLEGVKKFLYANGQNKDVFHTYSNQKTNHVVYQFALHLPYESEGYAFSLSIQEDGSLELYYSLGQNGGIMSDKFYADVLKKKDEISLTHSKIFRLVINTIAYMNCFPECVADGVPKDLFLRSENILARNVTFQVSDKIRDNDNPQLSKRPHFRKGHFKALQSDYYTHKKGQIIFVAQTMVKAKAKTVTMIDDTDKFTDNAIE